MRDHSHHIMLTREEALQALLEAAHFRPGTEVVPLDEALGRVCATDLAARVDVPSALCARMDGIAVRWADFEHGMPDTSGWRLGRDYGWANTGTAMPAGFDTCIPIEQVSFDRPLVVGAPQDADPGRISIASAPHGQHDCCVLPGTSFRAGEPLLPARTLLTPTRMSLLAMCGYAEVEVVRRPRVAFIPTGDELVEPGSPLPPGKVYDSNGVLLDAKLRSWGADPIVYPCVPDDWDQIEAALLRACGEADIVTINAGSSKGSKDFTMEILEQVGTVLCHETNHGPGRHNSASVVDGTPVLGLSGPPAACEITADWYLKPLVDCFLYGHAKPFGHVRARLAQAPVPARADGRTAGRPGSTAGRPGPAAGQPPKGFFVILPMRLERQDDGSLLAAPVSSSRHPNLRELDAADGYLEASPQELRQLQAGDEVRIELRRPLGA